MKFINVFEKYDWFSGTWVIYTALERWATLKINASGNIVPKRLYQINLFESLFLNVKYQSLDQQKEWDRLTGEFYSRIMKRANAYESTFSAENIKLIYEYINNISDIDIDHPRIPKNTKVAKIRHSHRVKEQHDGLRIAEFMLHLDEANALSFLEKLSIYWAANLIPNSPYEQGLNLYLLAEQME